MSIHVQKLIRLLIIPFYSVLVWVLKVALAFLPNIEVVTFLLAFGALIFPLYMALIIPCLFAFLEVLLHGNGSWVFLYFTVWPLLVIVIWTLQKLIKRYWWIFVIITSLWGFCFGTLDALLYLINHDINTFYTYWMASITFDVIHGVGNFMVSVFLYKPIMMLWKRHLAHFIIIDNNTKIEKAVPR